MQQMVIKAKYWAQMYNYYCLCTVLNYIAVFTETVGCVAQYIYITMQLQQTESRTVFVSKLGLSLLKIIHDCICMSFSWEIRLKQTIFICYFPFLD